MGIRLQWRVVCHAYHWNKKKALKKRKTAGCNLMFILIPNCRTLHGSRFVNDVAQRTKKNKKSSPVRWTNSRVPLCSDKWTPETPLMLFIHGADREPVARALAPAAPTELRRAILVVRRHLPRSCPPLPAVLLPAPGCTGSLQPAPVASHHVQSPSLK